MYTVQYLIAAAGKVSDTFLQLGNVDGNDKENTLKLHLERVRKVPDSTS
jgi:hypothetical protein